jgi:hypothetical protein
MNGVRRSSDTGWVVMSSGEALVVVAEIGSIGLLNEITAVLVEKNSGQAIAVIDVDEEAA